VGNRALGKRDKKERRERKLELTWNGKGSYVWKGRRREGVKEEKEGSEWGRRRNEVGEGRRGGKRGCWKGSGNWEREGNKVGELGMVGKVGRCGKLGKVDN